MSRRILLIELCGDERTDSEQIYIEDPSGSNLEALLRNHVGDLSQVEYAEIVEVRSTVASWPNDTSDRVDAGISDMPPADATQRQRVLASARAVVAKATECEKSSVLRPFTVFCQETGGTGTIHINTVEAADLESAILAGKRQCIEDWSAGTSVTKSCWNMETVHCLGVAEGAVTILHWEDQCD